MSSSSRKILTSTLATKLPPTLRSERLVTTLRPHDDLRAGRKNGSLVERIMRRAPIRPGQQP